MMAITSLSRASAIFLGTFASEDGAFLASLALARQGVISLGWACAACGGGIFAGDLGLFWLGRAGRFSARRYGWMNRLVARARDRAPVRPDRDA